MADDSRPKRLLLVDGFVFFHRAHHIHSHFQDRQGRPTGAMYGVVNAIQGHMRRIQPDYAALALDAPGPTFRHELFPAYKANRPPMDPDLRDQIEPLIEMIDALGLPMVREAGIEADDVIGTLSLAGREAGMDVVILTADKDMAQLVEDNVVLHDTNKPPMDAARVKEKFEVTPEQFIDYLALCGDAADNIPGISKVGPRTAATWLERFGTLDEIIANADKIKGKVGENLRGSLEELELYRTLVTIKRDCELPVTLEDLVPRPRDEEKLRALYERYDFRGFLRELNAANSPEDEQKPAPAVERGAARALAVIKTQKDLKDWVARCREAGTFCVHAEYTGVPPATDLVGIALSVAPGQGAYVPFGHADAEGHTKLSAKDVGAALDPLLADPKLTRIGHDIKTLRAVLGGAGLPFAEPVHDGMLESYVHRTGLTRHDLRTLARIYLEEEVPPEKEIIGTGKKQVSFDQIAVEAALPYVRTVCDATLRLHQHLWPRLRQEPKDVELYQKLELPMARVLGDMEHVGMHIDTKELARQERALQKTLEKTRAEIFAECGHEFNLEATRELAQVLYEERGLKPGRKTSTGAASTSAEVLEQLAEDDVLPSMVLEYRQCRKLLSTYITKLPKMIDANSGRLHTSFQQALTSTGRLSSTNPNLQNIPIRTPDGRKIRRAFAAPEGHTLIAADYSQIELRIMAHISEDPGLCMAFAEGRDVHQATAAEVFGVALEDVTQDQRRSAKAINFGLMYGMGAFGLARGIGATQAEASVYIEKYFERYPAVRTYMDRTRKVAKEKGYVETIWGRRLYIEGIQMRHRQQQAAAERQAINAPMQGTAADIIKRAMVDLHAWLGEHHPDCHLLLQVHDELVLEVPEAKVDAICEAARERMEAAAELRVPLLVEVGCGQNWDEAHG